jgi:hypothetical protein
MLNSLFLNFLTVLFLLQQANREDELELASIGFKCAVGELYEDVLGLS